MTPNKYEQFVEKELNVLFQARLSDLANKLKLLASETNDTAFQFMRYAKNFDGSYCRTYSGLTKHNGEWQVANLIRHIEETQKVMNDLGLLIEADKKDDEESADD